MNNGLKSCPFCGGNAHIVKVVYPDIWYIHCDGCQAMMGYPYRSRESEMDWFFDTEEMVLEAWNRRVDE